MFLMQRSMTLSETALPKAWPITDEEEDEDHEVTKESGIPAMARLKQILQIHYSETAGPKCPVRRPNSWTERQVRREGT